MKITIPASVAAAVALSAVTTDAAAVNLEVACKGIDYNTLSAKALSFSARALESTFNSVHKDMDGTTLTLVASTGTLIGSGQLRGADIALTFSAKEAPLKGQDTSIDDFMCRLCGGDDAAAGLVDASKRKAWESLFAASISSGPHAAFKSASQCSIKARSNDGNQMVVLDSNVPVGVEVDVHCDNVNFADLSVRGIAASSNALKETYNSIHQALDGSKLGNVVMAGNRLRVGDLSIDDFMCRLCGGDDALQGLDAVSFTAIAVKSEDTSIDDFMCRLCGGDDSLATSAKESLKAWEQLFVSRLLKEPSGEFNDVKHCSISMKQMAKKQATN